MKNIMKRMTLGCVSLLIVCWLASCNLVPIKTQIAESQSKLVTLTIECDKGIANSCEKMKAEKLKLQELLKEK